MGRLVVLCVQPANLERLVVFGALRLPALRLGLQRFTRRRPDSPMGRPPHGARGGNRYMSNTALYCAARINTCDTPRATHGAHKGNGWATPCHNTPGAVHAHT